MGKKPEDIDTTGLKDQYGFDLPVPEATMEAMDYLYPGLYKGNAQSTYDMILPVKAAALVALQRSFGER